MDRGMDVEPRQGGKKRRGGLMKALILFWLILCSEGEKFANLGHALSRIWMAPS